MSRKSKKYPNEFRSGFEYDVSKQLQPYGFSYEPWQIEYRIERKYTPDFVYERNGKLTSLNAKDTFAQATHKSIVRSLSVCQRRMNSYLY